MRRTKLNLADIEVKKNAFHKPKYIIDIDKVNISKI